MTHLRTTASNDDELLARLREGDDEAYTELWRRHIAAALGAARRLIPDHAEDLASEAFLAVYHQVTVARGGPTSSFRAYLLTTIRNTAMRWRREREVVVNVAAAEHFDLLAGREEESPLDLLTAESTASELLDSITALPERWQRVLWLTEVEGASRSQIALELGIKPNAVSVLYRRALGGLRMEWLAQQIPVELRNDEAHVAHLLPRFIVDGRADGIARRIQVHLAECGTCAALDASLRDGYAQMRKITLSLAGFAALGGTIPAAFTSAAAGTAAAVTATGLVAFAVAASLSIFAVGGAVLPEMLRTSSARYAAESGGGSTTGSGNRAERSGSENSAAAPARSSSDSRSDPTEPEPDAEASTGRHVTDPAIAEVDFVDNTYVSPERPKPQHEAPGPREEPPNDDGSSFSTGIESPDTQSGYLAPSITGRTLPGAEVIVETGAETSAGPQRYLAVVQPSGEWLFDFGQLYSEKAGTYSYRVWASANGLVSSADVGEFVLLEPTITGFESVSPFEIMPADEAALTGIVFSATGAANGEMCLDSVYAGQSARIPLDASGRATKRLRMLEPGTYYFAFRACDDDSRGPAFETFVDVGDPDSPAWSPFGNDPALTEFVLDDAAG
ncbi:sigma-70 family RNA polymerase sigma factor [Leucobacter sp. CSA1]|uniref:Sigma-70 family RNA polymerase sigma factor n=1 Tax=Leucobacter chromiisoli TaxID=2796471 RepID=A0A934Q6K0_9MICO|nr:sigma-70 family RNA polymerase sigma factor [Leucobacter chromiisoli]MBK0417624.1 sigma-70 family RNA polymerase sigma factor [Leucobacter chromiisoli]